MDRPWTLALIVLAGVAVLAWFMFGTGHPACEPHQSLSWLKC